MASKARLPVKSDSETSSEQMRPHAADAAGLMKALGNESRLMILCLLAEGERPVGDINEIIPLSQSALSQQLARLRAQGLVDTRRESQTIYYSLADGPADRVIRLLHDIYCEPLPLHNKVGKQGKAIIMEQETN